MFGISRARKAPISDCGAFSDERAEGFASGAPGPSIEAPGPSRLKPRGPPRFLQRLHFHGMDAGKGFSALLSVDWDSADVVNGVV